MLRSLAFIIAVITYPVFADGLKDDLSSKIKLLEQRLIALEKKVDESEVEQTVCLNEKKNVQNALEQKEQDIKDCAAHLNFKGTYEGRNIGFGLVEILKGGCTGAANIHVERFRGENQVEKTETNYDGPVITKMGGRMGSNALLIEKVEKKLPEPSGFPRSTYENELDFKMREYDNREYTSVVLGKMYNISQTRSGGTLGKGVYNTKYNVVQNKKGQLVVNLEQDRAEQWTHIPTGEKAKSKLTVTCKTLKQLNELAMQSLQPKIDAEISKKVFGQ